MLLCKESYCVCKVFREFDEMPQEGSNNPSKQHYDPVIHQRFGESNIQVVILTLKGRMANQIKPLQAVMQENACVISVSYLE